MRYATRWLVFTIAAALSAAEGPAADPGAPPPVPAVVISEIHFHPRAEQADTEFIEIENAGPSPVDLSGFRFEKGVKFTFPPGVKLAPGGQVVAVKDLAAFRKAFGELPAVAGVYQGRLSHDGEVVRLADAAGKTVSVVRYFDSPPWPAIGEGGLTLSRIESGREAADPSNWAAAAPTPGAPNRLEPRPVLSLYRARHSPDMPLPGKAVEISVTVRKPAPAVKVLLHYEAGGRAARAITLREKPAAAGRGDSTFTGVLPPQPASTLVRYWFEATAGTGPMVRFPARDAPTPHHALYVRKSEPDTKLPLYELLISPRVLADLEANPYSNELHPASFIAGKQVFDPVQVRYRGAWARSWPKKSWKVVFARDRRLGGERRLNLNSAFRDPAFLREPLAYQIYRDAGALSVRARMVRVHLNDQYLGLYVEVEQPRASFLEGAGMKRPVLFKAASRENLADERPLASIEAYAPHYTLEAGPPASYEVLHDFLSGLAEAPDPARFLEDRLDVPRYLAYLCAGAFTQNWDSYNKNHLLALDAGGTRKWSAAPWDLDRTMGDSWNWQFDVDTLPLLSGTQRFPGTTGWNRLEDRFLGAPSLRKRFEGRLLELLADAFSEEKLWPTIDRLRDEIAAEVALDRSRWGGHEDFEGAVAQLKRYVARRRAFLLAQLPGGEPARPRNERPAPGAAGQGFPLVLASGPYSHPDPKVLHRMTRWQIRRDGSDYTTPAVDFTSATDLTSFTVARGMLLPGARYFWRISHIASNGKVSEPSAETSFVAEEFELQAVPFDLKKLFNRDVVANPGDRSSDSIDLQGGRLVERGYDGTRATNPAADGLPHDRKVGVHVLGDYAAPNVLQLTAADRSDVRLAVPPAKYSFVRFLVTGGGDSDLPVVFEYQDGTTSTARLPCDDWYDDLPPDDPPGSVRPPAVPILNGLDRMRSGVFKDRNEPAIFEVSLPVDATKELRAIVLPARGRVFELQGRAKFNLFAATGIRLGTR